MSTKQNNMKPNYVKYSITRNQEDPEFPRSFELEVAEKTIEGRVYIDLGYGYNKKLGFNVDASGNKTWVTEKHPSEGDIWELDDKLFTIGKPSGMVSYSAPLLDANGTVVAIVSYEFRYQD